MQQSLSKKGGCACSGGRKSNAASLKAAVVVMGGLDIKASDAGSDASGVGGADIVLHCSDGDVKAHSQLLSFSSPFFKGIFEATSETSIQVQDTTKAQWELIEAWMSGALAGQPWPDVTMEQAKELVPLSHKYNFPGMHADLDKIIQAVVSQDLSLVPGAPSFVLRWLDYAGRWALPKLEACCLDFIRAKRCGLLPGGGYAHGVAEVTPEIPERVISFKALVKSGRIDADLQKLSPPVLLKVMKAAFTAAGCQGCTAPGTWECMCPTSGAGANGRSLTSCVQCKTRSLCSRCTGWLDV